MHKLLFLLLLVFTFGSVTARADLSVSVFYDSLDPYGEWVEIEGYGYCWTPGEVASDWRPYTDGAWVYTDAGWTWVSDEPYGWAVYHYGRWLHVDALGWVWVPDVEWGPAWVSWRRSPEYVGWAPLPPEARFNVSVGISHTVDVRFDIGPAYYSFVPVRHFGARRLRTVIIEPQRNITIIRETRNITNITYVNNTVINRGPDYAEISGLSEEPVRRLKLDRRTDFEGRESEIKGGAKITGDALSLPAPRIERQEDAKPKKVARKVSKEKVRRGWEDAGSPEEIEALRTEMSGEGPVPSAGQAGKEETSGDSREKTAPKPAVEDEPEAPKKTTQKKERDDPAPAVSEPEPAEEPAQRRKKADPKRNVEEDATVGADEPSRKEDRGKKARPEKRLPEPEAPAPEVRGDRPEQSREVPASPKQKKGNQPKAEREEAGPPPQAPRGIKKSEPEPEPAFVAPPVAEPLDELPPESGKDKDKDKKK